MTPHPLDRLSEYLDDDLAPAERAAIDQHLASCEACRSTLDDLRALRLRAGALASDMATPTTDLWPGIAARLAGPREVAPPAAMAPPPGARVLPWYRRRVSIGVVELALAASLVAAIGGALLVTNRRVDGPATPAAPAPIVAQAESLEPEAAVVAPVNFADRQYDAAVTDLERMLREHRDRLDPRTVVVLERNLRVIDDAIAEARQALAADPANSLLNAHLAGARQRKLDLLRRAAQITVGD
ncbi:MAG: zf-HC2 domain-containing protein [Vicinamibacterales bacterium]